MSPTVESIIERLDDARQRWWLFSLLSGIVLAVTLSIVVLVLVVLIDTFQPLPLVWLRLLLVGWGGVAAALLVSTLYRSIRHPRGLEATARRVELSFPDLGSHLINLVQFSSAASAAPSGPQQAAVAEAASSVGSVPFHQAASRHTRWARWRLGLQTPRDLAEATAALVLVLGLLCLLAAVLPKWSSSLQRMLTPWQFVPQVGAIDILEVLPGDTTLPLGATLSITATIAMPDGEKVTGLLLVTPEGDAETSRPMVAGATGESFSAILPMVVAPLRYRLQIGDSQSDIYRVLVRAKPAVEEVEVAYHYPAYLGMRDRTIGQQHADLEAPQYTTADLTMHCSAPLARGYVETPAGKVLSHVGEDRRILELSLDLAKPITYSIHLVDENGFTDPEPRANTVHVIEDSPPTARMVKPAGETSVVPNGEVPLVVRVGDDHGLGEVRLEWKFGQPEEGESESRVHTLRRWPALAGATRSTLSHAWTIDPTHFRPGRSILVRAVAIDRRRLTWRGTPLKPQSTASPWRTIRLLDAERKASETFTQLETFHAGLWKILRVQVRARMAGAGAEKKTELADTLELVGEVRQRQIQVQTASAALAASIDPQPSAERTASKQVLNRLAYGEMLRAVQQSESIVAMAQRDAVRQGLPPLIATQDRILDSLRRLLEANRRAMADSLAAMKQRFGGDLPGEVQEKIRELAKKLSEFVRQQRRIIEATKNLAQKPMEDFTEEEERQLKELAAAEDDWSRFMEETHTDFSKLPEQDFANPSLLEELVEVQTEIKMAADALTKKTVDIAVPLEQLGAEMAEELITNIEKWLPDTPDRQRWSQEEPLTDQKEAPMAELPGELEDLVGELMEEEEALFDEMEDVSSSWDDSIDKGAGWDAMDGPISNMSAKGVTGNRLPNTSEIGGRSGEGRQGRASGEFVAETAVGKGGRKTPSRLAPDPQVQGQVKDTSKDPVGGATGGGKESGVGGEGLEGPVPRQVQRDLKRLATKQADLRNRAESIDLKFQVLNYHHTDFNRLLERMAAVERDLLSGRYRSALRRRVVVLDRLQSIKNTLAGEAEVRKDQTINLPADIQQELLGGMQEASPKGWEELNREYFERLSRPEMEIEP